MKHVNALVLLVCLFQALASATDDPGVQEIKKLYARTAAAIVLAQKNEAGGLYCNELTLNSRNGSWRGVGNYLKKAVFWYSDQPEFAMAEGRKAEATLLKVEVRETSAVTSLYREFFFADGRLCFYFRGGKNGDEPVREERVYLKDGKLLQRLLGLEVIAAPLVDESILSEARYWQDLFLLSFAE
jgi:hypothetical protein